MHIKIFLDHDRIKRTCIWGCRNGPCIYRFIIMYNLQTMGYQKGDTMLDSMHMLPDHPEFSRETDKGFPGHHDKRRRTCIQGCENSLCFYRFIIIYNPKNM